MENTNETESRLMALEIKLSYLENFVNKLQEIAVEHTNTIDVLKAENRVLKEKISELIEAQEGEIPNRRPPHY
ncbi:MAG: SlyX family protein [Treponemataceae bacterium]|nr:SlyX family protein [Treponemataceae bacterium]